MLAGSDVLRLRRIRSRRQLRLVACGMALLALCINASLLRRTSLLKIIRNEDATSRLQLRSCENSDGSFMKTMKSKIFSALSSWLPKQYTSLLPLPSSSNGKLSTQQRGEASNGTATFSYSHYGRQQRQRSGVPPPHCMTSSRRGSEGAIKRSITESSSTLDRSLIAAGGAGKANDCDDSTRKKLRTYHGRQQHQQQHQLSPQEHKNIQMVRELVGWWDKKDVINDDYALKNLGCSPIFIKLNRKLLQQVFIFVSNGYLYCNWYSAIELNKFRVPLNPSLAVEYDRKDGQPGKYRARLEHVNWAEVGIHMQWENPKGGENHQSIRWDPKQQELIIKNNIRLNSPVRKGGPTKMEYSIIFSKRPQEGPAGHNSNSVNYKPMATAAAAVQEKKGKKNQQGTMAALS